MKSAFLFTLLLCLAQLPAKAQLYFPPLTGQQWDTLSPASLGWCPERIDSLYQHLENTNSKAFILLKDGKIVLEKYFNGHAANLPWYWASAGKTLTAFLTGIAQQESFLSIEDSSSKYLGLGWTSCTPLQEGKIKIRDQLTMTSGLDDAVANNDCTLDSCLQYQAEAGTRWAYHNAPYTLLDSVIKVATGRTLNQYMNQKVKLLTGMDGLFLKQDFNNVFYSTARSMARFGLMILNRGKWNSTPVLSDTTYFKEMVSPSQFLNLSYGYLWWLNGMPSFMAPTSQLVFPGSYNPDAPADMYSGIGKNGQFVQVIPSLNMVWIRLGEAAGSNSVPFAVSNDIWKKINLLNCNLTARKKPFQGEKTFQIVPNPATSHIRLSGFRGNPEEIHYSIFNPTGIVVKSGSNRSADEPVDVSALPTGHYFIKVQQGGEQHFSRFIRLSVEGRP
jgi:CubicO group peptidase (beta-lactamase class C family)